MTRCAADVSCFGLLGDTSVRTTCRRVIRCGDVGDDGDDDGDGGDGDDVGYTSNECNRHTRLNDD